MKVSVWDWSATADPYLTASLKETTTGTGGFGNARSTLYFGSAPRGICSADTHRRNPTMAVVTQEAALQEGHCGMWETTQEEQHTYSWVYPSRFFTSPPLSFFSSVRPVWRGSSGCVPNSSRPGPNA